MHRITITGLIVLAALLALPVAQGSKPVRQVVGPPGSHVIPAGLGCPFDVLWEPSTGGFRIETAFSDGRMKTIGHGSPTVTNVLTGTSYTNDSRYEITEVYEQETNDVIGEGHGRFLLNFYPGDQGPSGEVGEDGAFFGLIGHFSYTFDFDTWLFTSFELSGTVTDLCAILTAE